MTRPNPGGNGNKTPVELNRLRGNPSKHTLPDVHSTQALMSADDIDMSKHVPAQLRNPGRVLWAYVWSAGAVWISPQTDALAVTKLCEVTDFAEIMRDKFIKTGELCYSREYLAATDKQIVFLRELGLTPVARSKLGVAEVKSTSRLEQLRIDRERLAARLAAKRDNGM